MCWSRQVQLYQKFPTRGLRCVLRGLMMEPVISCEKSINTYQITQRNAPKDSYLLLPFGLPNSTFPSGFRVKMYDFPIFSMLLGLSGFETCYRWNYTAVL
jgi:hypothetical protein